MLFQKFYFGSAHPPTTQWIDSRCTSGRPWKRKFVNNCGEIIKKKRFCVNRTLEDDSVKWSETQWVHAAMQKALVINRNIAIVGNIDYIVLPTVKMFCLCSSELDFNGLRGNLAFSLYRALVYDYSILLYRYYVFKFHKIIPRILFLISKNCSFISNFAYRNVEWNVWCCILRKTTLLLRLPQFHSTA